MPSRPRFTADQILDAAADLARTHGRSVTIQQIASAAGAPVGSIYYRFPSRDRLLAELWIRSVDRFHEQYLPQIPSSGDLSPGRAEDIVADMAARLVRHVRDEPANASAMTLFRQPALLKTVDPDLRDHVAKINDEVWRLLDDLCAARFPRPTDRRRQLVRVAAIQLPYGLVRPYVGAEPPTLLDQVADSAARTTLALGDHPQRRDRPQRHTEMGTKSRPS